MYVFVLCCAVLCRAVLRHCEKESKLSIPASCSGFTLGIRDGDQQCRISARRRRHAYSLVLEGTGSKNGTPLRHQLSNSVLRGSCAAFL